MPLPRAVIFDLDGTLVDTADDLAAAMNHCLVAVGRPPVDAGSVRALVGHGARKLLERGLDVTGGGTAEQVEALMPRFLHHYGRHICVQSRPYPGVERLMDDLSDAGVAQALCTNKPERLSRDLIDALGWSGRFKAILGGDSLPVRKPDPQHLIETIMQSGATPDEAIMIGDSHVDLDTARAAGVPVALVSFGFSTVPVADLAPDRIIDDYARDGLNAIRALHASR